MKNTIKHCLCFLIVITSIKTLAQTDSSTTDRYSKNNKGKFSVSWGGNRASYSRSDIRFKGNNYDFTVKDAASKDKPKGWHIDYVNPTRMTIPQTNAKLGYFITNNYKVSLGLDHMKYVFRNNRDYTVNGNINLPANEDGATFNGSYNNQTVFVSDDLLKFEHTDGLNFIFAEIARFDDISKIFGIQNTDKIQINVTESFGGGLLFPKTNATLLQKKRHDDFNVSGYGLAVSAGVNLTFYKYFFVQLDLKGGYIDMNDIRTTQSKSDSASQNFYFLERVISFGGVFSL